MTLTFSLAIFSLTYLLSISISFAIVRVTVDPEPILGIHPGWVASLFLAFYTLEFHKQVP